MQWDWPVIVSNLEAQAFCRWKGAQLGKNIRLISHEEHKLIVERTELPAGMSNHSWTGSLNVIPLTCLDKKFAKIVKELGKRVVPRMREYQREQEAISRNLGTTRLRALYNKPKHKATSTLGN